MNEKKIRIYTSGKKLLEALYNVIIKSLNSDKSIEAKKIATLQVKMKNEIDCRKCINFFEVEYEGGIDGKHTEDYCRKGIRQTFYIIKCPMYKPKAPWDNPKKQIIEEPKHIKRIERQRKRFDDKIIKKGNKGVLMHLDGKRR